MRKLIKYMKNNPTSFIAVGVFILFSSLSFLWGEIFVGIIFILMLILFVLRMIKDYKDHPNKAK